MGGSSAKRMSAIISTGLTRRSVLLDPRYHDGDTVLLPALHTEVQPALLALQSHGFRAVNTVHSQRAPPLLESTALLLE